MDNLSHEWQEFAGHFSKIVQLFDSSLTCRISCPLYEHEGIHCFSCRHLYIHPELEDVLLFSQTTILIGLLV